MPPLSSRNLQVHGGQQIYGSAKQTYSKAFQPWFKTEIYEKAMRQYVIRCQMDCAGNNCSRSKSSEEESAEGWASQKHSTHRVGIDAGLKA